MNVEKITRVVASEPGKAFVQRAKNARRCRRNAFNKTTGKERGRRGDGKERRNETDTQK